MHAVAISASPSPRSRSHSLLTIALERLAARGHRTTRITVRELPAQALILGDRRSPALRAAVETVAAADLLVVATPIYQGAYSGLLKLFLDLLPADALRGRIVLPLATGGSAASIPALDYALRPVLAALGARTVLDSVCAVESQLAAVGDGSHVADPALLERLDRALQPLHVADGPALQPSEAAGRPAPERCCAA